MQYAEKKQYFSPEEYFEMEEAAEYKSEYYHGEIFAMSGASLNHNIIVGNTFASLHSLLSDSDCTVFTSDMKIRVDEAMHYTYPDISIVCGDIEFAGNRDDTVSNPVVIIEVLSKSTKDYDKGSKFAAYQNIKSLKNYILIDQYMCNVEYFYKNKAGKWILDEYKNLDQTLKIRNPGIELPLKTVYNRVKW
ncbi:MAG: Uma2 family endonuclease [Desulfobacteraceae bacterium]|nr:Uma2 family endonuclease [Desulfobacteraceae bacterium]